MVTSKQANADIASVKKKEGEKGRRGGRWGRGGKVKMNIKKSVKQIVTGLDEDNGGDRGRGTRRREGRTGCEQQPTEDREPRQSKD